MVEILKQQHENLLTRYNKDFVIKTVGLNAMSDSVDLCKER